jgi:hypothetical protein
MILSCRQRIVVLLETLRNGSSSANVRRVMLDSFASHVRQVIVTAQPMEVPSCRAYHAIATNTPRSATLRPEGASVSTTLQATIATSVLGKRSGFKNEFFGLILMAFSAVIMATH